jgi:hypothetical protein
VLKIKSDKNWKSTFAFSNEEVIGDLEKSNLSEVVEVKV